MNLNSHLDVFNASKNYKYIIDVNGNGNFTDLQSCIDYIAGDTANRMGSIKILDGDYRSYGLVSLPEEKNMDNLTIDGSGYNTILTGISKEPGNTGTINNLSISNLILDGENLDNDPGLYIIADNNDINSMAFGVKINNIKIIGYNQSTHPVFIVGLNTATIKNLIVIGEGGSSSNQAGMSFGGVVNSFFLNCSVFNRPSNVGGLGIIDLENTRNNVFQNCIVDNVGIDGIVLRDMYSDTIDNCSFIGCIANNCTNSGFHIKTDNKHNTISNCYTDTSILLGGNNSTVVGCHATASITANGSSDILIGNHAGSYTINSNDGSIQGYNL